jgi:uncharacterized protein (TIGR00299 family) protein
MKQTPSRIAIFDPFSGAAGDMVLGALIDAGLSLDELRAGLRSLPLDGYEITATPANQHGLAGTHVEVIVADGQPQRDWASIQPMIAGSYLPEPVRTKALAIFERLATAEARVHGTEVATVHFHEVGAVDAIVDICGTALGLHLLGIDRVYSHPPVTGDGWVRAQHGLIPIPAPATAELLAMGGAPMGREQPEGRTIGAELLTPTGAAILTTLASFDPPLCTPTAVGYGFGRKELPWPNALRVWLADARPI